MRQYYHLTGTGLLCVGAMFVLVAFAIATAVLCFGGMDRGGLVGLPTFMLP